MMPRPIRDAVRRRWRALAMGKHHTVGVCEDGGVYAWGATTQGRCGLGSSSSIREDGQGWVYPRRLVAMEGLNVSDVCVGDKHNLALLQGGRRLYTWGGNADGQCGQGHTGVVWSPRVVLDVDLLESPIVQIAAKGNHSALVTATGHVFSWGYGDGGHLGHKIHSPLPTVEPSVGFNTFQRLFPKKCPRESKAFDSALNILLPRRMRDLDPFFCTAIFLGPGNSVVLSRERAREEHLPIPATAYDLIHPDPSDRVALKREGSASEDAAMQTHSLLLTDNQDGDELAKKEKKKKKLSAMRTRMMSALGLKKP